jgi:hypothetical protein
MSLQLDEEIVIENPNEMKVNAFVVDVAGRMIQVQYGIGNTVNGKFTPINNNSLVLQDDEFDQVVAMVPESGVSLYQGIKTILYDVIQSKLNVSGVVI